MKEVQLKEVIITTLSRAGEGVHGDPVRKVIQIWDKDGTLIAERDEHFLSKMEELQQHLANIDDHAKSAGNLYFSNKEIKEPEALEMIAKEITLPNGSRVLSGSYEWNLLARQRFRELLKNNISAYTTEAIMTAIGWLTNKIDEFEESNTHDSDQEPEEVSTLPRNIIRTDGSIVTHGTMKWYELVHAHLMEKIKDTQDITNTEQLLKELQWTSKKIQEMEKGESDENDEEPEILAGFKRELSGSVYPTEDWYKVVSHKLSDIAKNEPNGTRKTILKRAILWVSNKIYIDFND